MQYKVFENTDLKKVRSNNYNYDFDKKTGAFSSYINEKGEFYPCSFTEKWKNGGWGKWFECC